MSTRTSMESLGQPDWFAVCLGDFGLYIRFFIAFLYIVVCCYRSFILNMFSTRSLRISETVYQVPIIGYSFII